jgi:hypothetical protein
MKGHRRSYNNKTPTLPCEFNPVSPSLFFCCVCAVITASSSPSYPPCVLSLPSPSPLCLLARPLTGRYQYPYDTLTLPSCPLATIIRPAPFPNTSRRAPARAALASRARARELYPRTLLPRQTRHTTDSHRTRLPAVPRAAISSR